MIRKFPVTKLNESIMDKGVHIAKRGTGTEIAKCGIDSRYILSELNVVENASSDQVKSAKKAKKWIEEAFKIVTDSKMPDDIEIEFLVNHDCLLDLYNESSIRCDIDIATELDDASSENMPVLYAMGLLYVFDILSGSAENEALNSVIAFYEKLQDSGKDSINDTLSQPQLDTGNIFLRFLQNSVNKQQSEKDRLIAWVRGRAQVDLPYDDTDVIKALEEETDLAALRLRIYNTINDTYVESVDTENANRIADMCLEKGMRIVAGRFSRALYLDAMLMANAKVIDASYLQGSVSDLENLVSTSSLELDGIDTSLPGDFSRIAGEMQMIVNLTSENQVSYSQIEGATWKFKKALREFELYCLEKLDAGYSVLKMGIDKASMVADCRRAIRDKVEEILQGVAKVEASCLAATPKEPVFLIYLQRIFPLDAINMGTLNLLLDPFFGEDEEVHKLMRGCGHIMYTTANLQGWLKKCDDWIEALPAYAAYEIVPQDGKSYKISTYVWRAILEEVYKQNAENWAINIEDVMALEHIALAREMLVEERGLTADVEDCMGQLSKEEAIRTILKRESAQEIAQLAALIEAIYSEQCDQIARIVEKQEISRIDALKQVIENSNALSSPKNRDSVISKKGLVQRVDELSEKADKRCRDLPSVHVLTTLGPGETENVENWLEESMALYNVSRAYGLEATNIQKRVADHEKRIALLGDKIVAELDLEGDLYNIIQTEGLNTREAGIQRLISSFPEVSAKVAELAVLMEYEEKQNGRLMEPENANEPSIVIDYVNSHPELNEAISDDEAEEDKQSIQMSLARGKLVSSLGLGERARNYLRDHTPGRLGMFTARREVIVENGLSRQLENPKYRYESHGPLKKYNLLYTPSRVDLGIDEVESVKNIPKWIGGRDRQAANVGKSLYGLYNFAGPTAMPVSRFAEFLKVGENFFSRGGVFYLSLAAGANLDALGMGDFEFFRDQWNMRSDRIVLPAGETYGGFCVPKEFTLLYSVILAALEPKTSKEILDSFGVAEELRAPLMDDLREILQMRSQFDSALDWEAKAFTMLETKYSISSIQFTRLASVLESKGIISDANEDDITAGYRFANWVNKKAHGLEEINRSGPFRKVHLIHRLIKESRKKNPNILPDSKLIGIMSAPYKEGGRKEGREVPVSDVRFSAGARKLEIYAGTAKDHLLKHIDPEGRKLISNMFESFQSPADIRIVGNCTASDLLNHVPRSGLEEIAETINEQLLEIGLSQDIIDANCQIYGGDLEKWVDVKEMPESQRQTLVDEIGANIHLLVLSRRGVFNTYERAVQGVDFIDLGIPDPELLDLVDNMPRLLYLMRSGRPDSALVFADSTSGARRRTFSFRYSSGKRKAKELFALDDNAVYGALGLGRETVDSWRSEMQKERQYAQDLLDALIQGKRDIAKEIYSDIISYVRHEAKADEAAQEEVAARKFKVLLGDYRYISDAFGKVKAGLPLEQLDFGTWVILGGMYVLNGKASADEISTIRAQFEKAIGKTGGELTDRIVERFVKPRYEPLAEVELYKEIDTGISGSLKATEEKVGRLQKREARRREAVRVVARTRRQDAYENQKSEISSMPVSSVRAQAIDLLGDVKSDMGQEEYGRFLAWAEAAILAVGCPIEKPFAGAEVTDESYMDIATELGQLAIPANDDRDVLEDIASAMELLDIALIVEKTIDVEASEEMTIAIARFFDTTVNNHIFDYIPYHYHKQRGSGFESLFREEKLELAEKHHRWLYTYSRHLMATATDLKDNADIWLGDADRDIMALGVNVTDEREKFWYSYARLRDAVVLRHEGYPLPKILLDLDPNILKCNERANVAIVYPHGNTTVPVAVEQGVKLAKDGINLMLCAFPLIEPDAQCGRDVLKVPDGFMYISADDYKAALHDSGATAQEAEEECRELDNKGVLVAVKFREPIVIHGVFFHFTHPMRPYIGNVGMPLIQPIIWEAATHLKCRLPEMLKGSGIRTADQINWLREQSAGIPENEAKRQIRKALRQFAETHTRIIAKPEKESGGRMAKILPVRHAGQYLEENIDELTNVVYNISKVDNTAIQDVLQSHVRKLYSDEFLEDMVDRFAKIGVPVLLNREPKSPLYSYFRQVVALGKNGYEITHHITVISTRGIANVGQGGILYEYTDAIIDPKYREDMRREITKAALNSMDSQGKYIKAHWREMVEEYLQIHPEFADKLEIKEPGEDLTGFSDADIPYEMGDYMPVFLIDENDNLVKVFDSASEEVLPLFNEDGSVTDVEVFDENGNSIPRIGENGMPIPIPMFDGNGNRIARFDRDGNAISTLLVFKIEPNPGAGLWRPHNDQLPEERKGEGVFKIFKCLGERAQIYRDRLSKL